MAFDVNCKTAFGWLLQFILSTWYAVEDPQQISSKEDGCMIARCEANASKTRTENCPRDTQQRKKNGRFLIAKTINKNYAKTMFTGTDVGNHT